VVEDTEVVATVDLLLHRQYPSTKLKTRPSRLHQKTRLAHPRLVAHHLLSLRALTQAPTDTVPHLHSQKVTTLTMAMDHTTDAAVVVVAAADVEARGVVVVSSDHPPVFPPSCKT
jgi:hypothetical protein